MLLPLAGGDQPLWLTGLYRQLLGDSEKLWTAVALVPLFVWLWYRDQRQLQSSAPASTG